MKIIDAFIFYNEIDLIKYRINILNDIIDYFIIVESDKTFIGNEKKLYFQDIANEFTHIKDKIINVVCKDLKSNLNGKVDPWQNESIQRKYISEGINKININNEDLIIISDCDEIHDPITLEKIKNKEILLKDGIGTLEQDLFYYNLNIINQVKWSGVKILSYECYKNKYNYDPQIIRNSGRINVINNGGWHLSYFGNEDFIINKLKNFSHQEFNNNFYTNKEYIKNQIENNLDLYGRGNIIFKYIEILDNKYLPLKYSIYLKKFYKPNYVIFIEWSGIPYGILTDIEIFKKYLNCEIIWINCYENGKYNKQIFINEFEKYSSDYNFIIFVETDFFSLLNENHKRSNQKWIFLKNIDVNPSFPNYKYRLHLIDYCIARNKITYEILTNIKKNENYKFNILYTKFTSLDYKNKFYLRNIFRPDNHFIYDPNNKIIKINDSINIFDTNILNLSDIQNERSFFSFGRRNIDNIIEIWNKYENILPNLYIKVYEEFEKYKNIKNKKIFIINNFISDEEKSKIFNKYIFYINLSDNEGYCHNINEARSTGRIIIIKNVQPLNELITSEYGFVNDNYEKSILDAIKLSDQEINKRMELTRKKYLEDTNFFIEKITSPNIFNQL
jgi:beta-1,4-mannosyl-glycoprotein beta-1,4-N-acetylglucosaminyltransferase